MEEEKILNTMVQSFYMDKKQLEKYKQLTNEENEKIKQLMNQLNTTEFKCDSGIIAKLNVQNRESFNESALLEKLFELGIYEVIDIQPIINWDKVEDLIYNGKLNANILSPFKEIKKIISLRIKEEK